MSYAEAKARYAAIGVDTEAAIARLKTVPISLHCFIFEPRALTSSLSLIVSIYPYLFLCSIIHSFLHQQTFYQGQIVSFRHFEMVCLYVIAYQATNPNIEVGIYVLLLIL